LRTSYFSHMTSWRNSDGKCWRTYLVDIPTEWPVGKPKQRSDGLPIDIRWRTSRQLSISVSTTFQWIFNACFVDMPLAFRRHTCQNLDGPSTTKQSGYVGMSSRLLEITHYTKFNTKFTIDSTVNSVFFFIKIIYMQALAPTPLGTACSVFSFFFLNFQLYIYICFIYIYNIKLIV
jgi:hypothetical protein